ncbi:MAG: type II toxin-antitoxin system VapC family toxin [Oceanospirillaceae bacterium]|nr:type II toxin-antitoxin system VapC family toxin [Oceanospirillaceae bacterium]
MYMLDTHICIYIVKKRPEAVLQKFKTIPIGSAVMSVVTYAELEYGALKSNNSPKALGILQELSQYIRVEELHSSVSRHYAGIRRALELKGTPIGNNDLWIAAHARSLGHTLVTNNTKEFDRVTALRVENWTR